MIANTFRRIALAHDLLPRPVQETSADARSWPSETADPREPEPYALRRETEEAPV